MILGAGLGAPVADEYASFGDTTTPGCCAGSTTARFASSRARAGLGA
jgi:hypothetical protein